MPVMSPHGQANGRRTEFLPSPEEISAACAEIQAGWNSLERLARSGRLLSAVDYKRFNYGLEVTTWLPPVAREGGAR